MCREPASLPAFLGGGIAIPGETSRQNLQGSPPDWVAVVSPTAQPFESVLPADIRGPQGPSGPGVNWKGAYKANTAYNLNDMVSWNLAVYLANQPVFATDPAPGASAGSPKWSVLPRIIPNYRGPWDSNTFYNTSDLAMSAGGQKLYSLQKDTSTGSYQSSTAPENDLTNWSLVLDFPDSATAALWVGAVGTVLGSFAAIGTVGLGILTFTKDTVAQFGTAVANAPAVTALQTSVQALQSTTRETVTVLRKVFDELPKV